MRIPKNLEIPIAHYKSLKQYRPQIGDFIICHGWFTHYYGLIIRMTDRDITIVTCSIPHLLFAMSPEEIESSTKTISLRTISNSRNTYAIIQNSVWYL